MSNRPLGNFLLRTMVMVMLVPIILGMVPLSLFPASANPTAPTTNNTSDASALISSLYERVERSVVQISPQFSEFDIFRTPLPTENTAQGYGSGFVFDEQGHIVTNSHVVGAVNSTAQVTFSDGRSFVANVIGDDVFADIAVLKINQTDILEEAFDLVPLPIANSSTVRVGEPIVAVGYPFATSLGPKSTLSVGVISQTQRLILSDYGYQAAIQTDVDINPGNSGGPLLNINGEVVGINTAVFSQETGAEINYAVPSDMISSVVPWLIEDGFYLHPWIGIDAITLTSEMAQAAGMPSSVRGVLLYHLVSDGPADQAEYLSGTTTDEYGRIRAGDIIVGVDGNNVTTLEELFYYLEKEAVPFEPVLLSVNDHGAIEDIAVMVSYKIPSDIFYCLTCM
jgi:S1-C subfamily serine protease